MSVFGSMVEEYEAKIAALTAERDRLAAALIECYDAAIPQAMPWMGTDAEKSEYAAKVLANHLRGLNRLSVYQSAERDQLRAALALERKA